MSITLRRRQRTPRLRRINDPLVRDGGDAVVDSLMSLTVSSLWTWAWCPPPVLPDPLPTRYVWKEGEGRREGTGRDIQ